MCQVAVLARDEECSGDAPLPGAAGAADAVHIHIDVGRHIIVDDMRHMRDVQSAGGQLCSHQDGLLPSAELRQRLQSCTYKCEFTLTPFQTSHATAMHYTTSSACM